MRFAPSVLLLSLVACSGSAPQNQAPKEAAVRNGLRLELHLSDTELRVGDELSGSFEVINEGTSPAVLMIRSIGLEGGRTSPGQFFHLWTDRSRSYIGSCHGCAGLHPLREEDFVVLQPGGRYSAPAPFRKTVRAGDIGRRTAYAKYEFHKPALDERYFRSPDVRRLWDAAFEGTIESPPVEFEVGPK